MSENNICSRNTGEKLIFACSGAADVGQITDLAARRLTQKGSGRMFCAAGIAGRVSGIIETTKAAAKILAMDGCNLDCVKKSLELAGFNDFYHLRLTDLALEKGKSPATDDNIEKVVDKAHTLLN